ncbi:hypothetical protein BN14_11055 [Rhizoctonia solani AG-1 IB]|uniref:DUF6589 domain-containing protein n=1 Tax=Thanatephorus cucumeris (strain AG1-IB / isolate 7/3/14) TaxID=1108050 RepID=M5CA65_THACB|nr:hypothetical protein BN14_11055 [Rhizoctonia solani AG-1 IB]
MQVWLFTFAGSGSSKYTNELLELSAGFIYEFPEELQKAIMNNWLCNFSGNQGSWMPMDLMQEHHIRDLKDKSQHRDQDFEGEFFKKILSRNTRSFAQVRSTMNQALHLKDLSGRHGEAKHLSTRRKLLSTLEAQRIHVLVPGRDYGWKAQDDLMAGKQAMATKVSNFVKRPSSSHNSVTQLETSQNDETLEESNNGQNENEGLPIIAGAPPVVIDGQLVFDYEEEDAAFDQVYEEVHIN